MTSKILKILIILNLLYCFFIILLIFQNKITINHFLIFAIFSLFVLSFYYISNLYTIFRFKQQQKTFNSKEKRRKEKAEKNKNEWADDGFSNHNRTGRIFNDKEEKTIHNKEEFEQWKKSRYTQYDFEEKLAPEYITLHISIEEKKELTEIKLKQKYRKLAQIYHPDKETGDIQKMQEINEAYNKLLKNFS